MKNIYKTHVRTLASFHEFEGQWKETEWEGHSGIYSNGTIDAIVEEEEDNLLSAHFEGVKDKQYIRI